MVQFYLVETMCLCFVSIQINNELIYLTNKNLIFILYLDYMATGNLFTGKKGNSDQIR